MMMPSTMVNGGFNGMIFIIEFCNMIIAYAF